jgi:tetratricopeptide (TPR) repeat protein
MGTASMNTHKILLLALGLLPSLNVFAAYQIQSNEVNLLPANCFRLSQSNFEPDAYKIVKTKRMGPSLGPHIQHFCHGKKFVIRADKTIGTKEESYNLKRAIGEFDYVLLHTAAENKNGRYNNYLALTSKEKARVLKRLNATLEAIQMYQQAIKYNPKSTRAYAELSDLYKSLGMNDEARKMLEVGLKQDPKSKSLQRRLDKL